MCVCVYLTMTETLIIYIYLLNIFLIQTKALFKLRVLNHATQNKVIIICLLFLDRVLEMKSFKNK